MRLVLAACLLAGTVGRVQAGACPNGRLRLTPASSVVPTNVELRLVFDAPEVELVELADGTQSITASGAASAAELEVVVRKDGGAVVPTTIRRTSHASRPSLAVQPRSPLAARTRYAVVAHTKTADYVISRFMTGDGPDDVPPTLDKVDQARVFRWTPSSPPHWKDVNGSFAELTLSGVQDAAGYEIHELQPGEAPSESTLRVVTTGRGATVQFGSLSSCFGADFELPAVARRTKSQPLHLWIRAFDLAGNVSPLREVTLDLAKQRPR
jgi:hypothetical protein